MTQKEKILLHLKRHGSITQKEAIGLFQCYRLSGRILELRQEGSNIESVMMPNSNNTGRHAVYYLRVAT
jgi:hypothetical protein